MKSKIYQVLYSFLLKPFVDLFYPPVCHFCHSLLVSNRKIICSSCWTNLPRFGAIKFSKKGFSNRIYLLYKFDDNIRLLIHLFKYRRFLSLAKYFTDEIIGRYPYLSDNNYSCIIPVPLHKTRLRERGFNQSQILANYLGKYLKVPVRDKILFRTRFTLSQTRLDKNERHRNVANAFKCDANLKGKKVLLIDDIITTGNTLTECLKVLRQADAESIDILAIAGLEKTIFY